jgi:alpha-beta hydrolase superfamily lysophospholipase
VSTRTRCICTATLLIALTGCGGSASKAVERVHFRASDGVLLDGRLFGAGKVGVVFVHMGRPGDTQLEWTGMAKRLAAAGYLALTYDRRGVCPRGRGGCSHGNDVYTDSWKDIVGADRFLRRKRVRKIVVIGASIGAMAALFAASEHRIRPAALIEFAGINASYSFDRAEIRRIGGSKLFLSTRHDIYGGGDAAKEWYGFASQPKRLVLLPGSDHGTDVFATGLRERAERVVLEFVEHAAPAR